MRVKVKVPRLADSTDDFVVISWSVIVGGAVREGDALLTVETDKTEVDVPSPVSGTVVELSVGDGDDVRTGQVICVIDVPLV